MLPTVESTGVHILSARRGKRLWLLVLVLPIPIIVFFLQRAESANPPFSTLYAAFGWMTVAAYVLLILAAIAEFAFSSEEEEKVHLRCDPPTAIEWATAALAERADASGARWISFRKANMLGIRTGPASFGSRKPKPSLVTVIIEREDDGTTAVVRGLVTSRIEANRARSRRNVEAVAAALRSSDDASDRRV